MTRRSLTDDEVGAALRGRLPSPPSRLHESIFVEIGASPQERRLPSILARLTDADPVARRRSMLYVVLAVLALSLSVAAIAGGLLRDRRTPDLSLVPPSPVASAVLPTAVATRVSPTPVASRVSANPRPSFASPKPDPSQVSPTNGVAPGKDFGGWPTTSRNPAGVYSWGPGTGCARASCIIGWMHNGYGSGDVEMTIETAVEAPEIGNGVTQLTVADSVGTYRRLDAATEQWFVPDDGLFVRIQLKVRPGTSSADLAEAHAIVESMRTNHQDASHFKLYFTLTTDDWDSG
jgi:hypothetical protein